MSKKKIIISVILIILFGIIINVIFLAKDFGIYSLDKTIIALYKIKTDKNTDYVEVYENEYLVDNRKIRMSDAFNDVLKKDIETSTFEIADFEAYVYKDRICYSVVNVSTAH